MRLSLRAWRIVAPLALALVGIASHGLAQQVGPVDGDTGYPTTYTDAHGLTLELCIDDFAKCLLDDPPPFSFPDPFPDEAFWWATEAEMDTNNGGGALLVLAMEAAFGGPAEEVAAGNQVAFGRIRIRIDNLVPGARYRVTHPFGVEEFFAQVAGARGINVTDDVGCATLPCDFSLALNSRVSESFLTWDPISDAPAGFIGDPNVDHAITGSPIGKNFFQIEGPGVGEPGSRFLCSSSNLDCIRTDVFAVMGKIAPAVEPDPVPVPDEVIDIQSALFRQRRGLWRVRGTTTRPGPGTLITVLTGGTVVGTTTPDDQGRWRMRVRNRAVPPVDGVITVQSSEGGEQSGFPVRIR